LLPPLSDAARSIVQYKADEDKLTALDQYKLLGATGPTGDRNNFCEYIQKNIALYELRTGVPLSTHAAANYTRNQLAEALRQNPYQVSLLLAGWDAEKGPSMFYMDYLGSMHPMKIAAHGYASYFGMSIMDRYYKVDMSVEEAMELIQRVIQELSVRFILNLTDFKIKLVDKDGIKDMTPDAPAPEIDMTGSKAPAAAAAAASSSSSVAMEA
jgi:20S proteasome subunit beta 4